MVEDGGERSAALAKDGMRLRKALVDAVRATDPKHRDELAGMIPACLEFLSHFTEVFTVSYDLLLNWTITGSAKFGDGFGLEQEIGGFRRPFSIIWSRDCGQGPQWDTPRIMPAFLNKGTFPST